jgi:hypothetical protein
MRAKPVIDPATRAILRLVDQQALTVEKIINTAHFDHVMAVSDPCGHGCPFISTARGLPVLHGCQAGCGCGSTWKWISRSR